MVVARLILILFESSDQTDLFLNEEAESAREFGSSSAVRIDAVQIAEREGCQSR